jgi:predicted nucleic acid-binding protein
MPVVSNTSPLLNLSIIGQLSLLRSQFGTVTVPEAVVDELRIDDDLPGNHELRAAFESGWLQVQKVTNPQLVRVLRHTLDAGESEAIALAIEMDAEVLLLDERDARIVAKDMGMTITGVLGVLLRGYSDGEIEFPMDLIDRLQQEAGFHLSGEIVEKVRMAVSAMNPSS